MSQNPHRPRPAHIAFMSIPAHGHVNPGLGLVAALAERGHRVTYATTSEFAEPVRDAGADPVLYTSTLPSASGPVREWPDDLVVAQHMFLDETAAVVPQLEQAYRDDVPDLLVYDIAGFQALVLAERWGVPRIQLSPTHVHFEGAEDLVPEAPELLEVRSRFEAYFAERGTGLRYRDIVVPGRCIATIPKSFQLSSDGVSAEVAFVGPLLTERATVVSWEPPDDRPVLVISLGSAYNNRPDFYRECLRAFGEGDYHVVMAVGHGIDPADLGDVPPHVEVHQWIPQLAVLGEASAFITHAGMGGTMEGLYRAVPMVAVPQAVDQFMNAARLEELGVGRRLDSATATAADLRAAVDELTRDADVHRRLREIQREMLESGGLRRAVEVVESEL